MLDTYEVEPVLDAYGLNILPTWIAHSADDAVTIAGTLGYPVALKLRSPDIAHKSDVQGVMLYLRDKQEVATSAAAIIDRAEKLVQ